MRSRKLRSQSNQHGSALRYRLILQRGPGATYSIQNVMICGNRLATAIARVRVTRTASVYHPSLLFTQSTSWTPTAIGIAGQREPVITMSPKDRRAHPCYVHLHIQVRAISTLSLRVRGRTVQECLGFSRLFGFGSVRVHLVTLRLIEVNPARWLSWVIFIRTSESSPTPLFTAFFEPL